jgi:hypothetical protein
VSLSTLGVFTRDHVRALVFPVLDANITRRGDNDAVYALTSEERLTQFVRAWLSRARVLQLKPLN